MSCYSVSFQIFLH